MITELYWFERWWLRANHQAEVDRDLVEVLKRAPVLIGAVVCARYHTEHVLNTDFNIWDTTVKIHDFTDLNELVLQIQFFQVEKQFGYWDAGWNRQWTYVWFDPVFNPLAR